MIIVAAAHLNAKFFSAPAIKEMRKKPNHVHYEKIFKTGLKHAVIIGDGIVNIRVQKKCLLLERQKKIQAKYLSMKTDSESTLDCARAKDVRNLNLKSRHR